MGGKLIAIRAAENIRLEKCQSALPAIQRDIGFFFFSPLGGRG
jgi:hypothetical protein